MLSGFFLYTHFISLVTADPYYVARYFIICWSSDRRSLQVSSYYFLNKKRESPRDLLPMKFYFIGFLHNSFPAQKNKGSHILILQPYIISKGRRYSYTWTGRCTIVCSSSSVFIKRPAQPAGVIQEIFVTLIPLTKRYIHEAQHRTESCGKSFGAETLATVCSKIWNVRRFILFS